MIDNRFIVIIICCITSLYSSCISANVPPSSSSNWRRRHNDDIPIMGNGRRRRFNREDRNNSNKRSSRRRRRRRKDDNEPPFFLLNEDSDDDDDGHHRQPQYKRKHRKNKQPLDSFRHYIMDKTGMQIPHININFDPITIIKLRKSWSNIIPFGIIRVGADFETHRSYNGGGLWRIRGCIEDTLLGGRFTIKERRRLSREEEEDDDDDDDDDRALLFEYTKSWLFAGGGSIGTRFNLCAAYDITTHRTSARFGFRTENTLNTIGTYHMLPGQRRGFTIIPIIPLDNEKRLLLEAKTNIDLPEPEFVIGTADFDAISGDTGGLELGIGGDIDVDVEEVNLTFSF